MNILGHILVIDDEEPNLKLLEAVLKPIGYTVTLLTNGKQALEQIEDISPDVILLDVMMPEMDGFEVVRKLKGNENTKAIPVVMVTALNDVNDRILALENGADDFLSKPVEVNELKARVASLMKVKQYNDHVQIYQQTLKDKVMKRTGELLDALEQIKQLSLESIYILTKASEYKDEDTGNHIIRMSKYCELIANAMGMGGEFNESILYSSPMHDIGKLGIPDKVLLKPGKLEPYEWEVMKQHTTIGGKILEEAKAPLFKSGIVIALNHHERWDGSGYPEGKKGEKIPIEARIAALADVFDALTSRRPYKEAFSVEKSLSIIQENSGSHFDPQVVDSFVKSLDSVMEIKKMYDDESSESLLHKMNKGLI